MFIDKKKKLSPNVLCVCVAFTYRSTSVVRVQEFSRTRTPCGWTTENENGRCWKAKFSFQAVNLFRNGSDHAPVVEVLLWRMIDGRGMKIKLKVITDTYT